MAMIDKSGSVNANYKNVERENLAIAQPLKRQYAESLKSVSSDQLFLAMKGQPKSDLKLFGFIPIGRSTEYKQVVAKLEEFKNAFASVADNGIETLNMSSVSDLKKTLQEAYEAASTYQDAHATDKKKAPRREVMENLKKSLGQEMRALDKLVETKGNFKTDTTIGDAFAIFKSGLNSAAIIENPHKNKTLVSHQVFGQGQINTVSIASFKKSDNTIEQRVLKPLSREIEKFGDFEDSVGLDPKNAKVGERNLASAGVANLLGLGHMFPKPSITVFEGMVCLDMPLAQGEPAQKSITFPITEGTKTALEYNKAQVEIWKNTERYQDKVNGVERCLAVNGIESHGRDEEGREILTERKLCQLELPFSSSQPNELTANLQKALMDLQVLDVLTGQVDRHLGNYFIKVSGNDVSLTAIDNDACFGENEQSPVNTLVDIKRNICQWTGLPPVMTQRTADMLKGLDPDLLRFTLKDAGLENKEIGLTLGRLAILKEHVGKLENQGLVTDDFLNFTTKEPGTNNDWSMSDLLNTRMPGQQTTNYVFKANDVQEGTLSVGYPLAPLDPQKHNIADN